RHRVVVSDVDRERLAAVAIQDDNAHHSPKAGKEVALAPLVVVQPTDDALPGPDEVRLPDLVRQGRRAHQLHEPAPLVFVPPERKHLDPLDHALLTPFARTKSFTS